MSKAQFLFNMKRHKEALSAIESGLTVDPMWKEIWNAKGLIFDDLEKYSEALEAYNNALKIDSKYIDALLNKGVTLKVLGNFKESVKSYEKVLEIDPDNKIALNNKGLTLKNSGKSVEALEAFEASLRIDPNNKNALNNKGSTLNKLGRYEEALQVLESALLKDTKYKHTYLNKGDALINLERYSESQAAYQAVLKIDPKDKSAWNSIGVQLCNMGKYQEGLVAYEEALNIDSNFKFSWNNKGVALQKLGKYKEALEAYATALNIDSKYKEAWNNKGMTLRHMGEFIESVNAYDEALWIDQEYKEAWNNKGFALNILEKYPEALKALETAIMIDKNFFNPWNQKASILQKLAKYEEALECCLFALRINDKYADTWCNKGSIFKNLQKYQEASEGFNYALKIDPQHNASIKFKEECEKFLENLKTKKIKPRKQEFSNEPSIVTNYLFCPLLTKDNLMDESFIKSKYLEEDIRLIGRGGYGKVILVREKDRGSSLAVKIIETSSIDTYQKSLKELVNLNKIGEHPNILTFLSYSLNPIISKNKIFQIFIEMPLGKTSLEKILKIKSNLFEEELKFILKQLCIGLKFGHECKLVHMDLKPDNILLVDETYKIADWGGSLQLRSSESTSVKAEINGTWDIVPQNWRMENMEKKKKYNFYLCDNYSMAMIAIRMCGFSAEKIRKIPKGSKKYHDLYFEEEIVSEIKKHAYSENLINTIRRMAAFDPIERLSLTDAINYLD